MNRVARFARSAFGLVGIMICLACDREMPIALIDVAGEDAGAGSGSGGQPPARGVGGAAAGSSSASGSTSRSGDAEASGEGGVSTDGSGGQPIATGGGGSSGAAGSSDAASSSGGQAGAPSAAGAGGETSEVLCIDQTDNDLDGNVDCKDSDCAGTLCRASTRAFLVPRLDAQIRTTPEGDTQTSEDPAIKLLMTPMGAAWGVLEFGQLVASLNVKVISAELSIFFQEGLDPIQIKDGKGRIISEPTPPQEAGVRHYDVTKTVKTWLESASESRLLEVHYVGVSPGNILFYTNEDPDGRGPKLVLEYEATCPVSDSCPSL